MNAAKCLLKCFIDVLEVYVQACVCRRSGIKRFKTNPTLLVTHIDLFITKYRAHFHDVHDHMCAYRYQYLARYPA